MALEKTTEITEIRINDTWNVGVRTDTVIKKMVQKYQEITTE